MAVKIALKSGTSYVVEHYAEEVHKRWMQVLADGISPTQEFEWVDSGIPRRKVYIDMREIEHIVQERR